MKPAISMVGRRQGRELDVQSGRIGSVEGIVHDIKHESIGAAYGCATKTRPNTVLINASAWTSVYLGLVQEDGGDFVIRRKDSG